MQITLNFSLTAAFVILCTSLVSKKTEQAELICWDAQHKLQWQDYQGTPAKSFASAITVANIEVYPSYDKKQKRYKYKVSNSFNRRKSWVKKDNSQTVYSEILLAHEQLHFDISELYSRKLRYEFEKVEKLQKNQVKDVVYQKIITEIIDERDVFDELYDKETSHGRIIKKQDEWEQKLKSELHKLENYSTSVDDCKGLKN